MLKRNLVSVGKSFQGDEFYILALSLNNIKLFHCVHYRNGESYISEMELGNIPTNLSKAMSSNYLEKQLHSHTSSGQASRNGRAIYHGQGVGTNHHKNNILQFFRQVDKNLHKVLAEKKSPLILAGVDYLLPIYQKASKHRYLIKEAVKGSPEKLNKKDLYKKCWSIAKTCFKD